MHTHFEGVQKHQNLELYFSLKNTTNEKMRKHFFPMPYVHFCNPQQLCTPKKDMFPRHSDEV